MSKIVRQVVLFCIEPEQHHNKFYEITVVKKDLGSFTIGARWGRRENFKSGSTQSISKGRVNTEENANSIVLELMNSKKKKGYQLHSDTNNIKYEDIATEEPITDWWNSIDEDNIEERVV